MKKPRMFQILLAILCILPLTLGCFLTNSVKVVLSDEPTTVPPQEPLPMPEEPAQAEESTQEIIVEPNLPVGETEPTSEVIQGGASHDPVCVQLQDLKICVPYGFADNLVASTIPAYTDQMGAPWEIAPEHYEIALQGYKISDTFWEPKITIYPIAPFQQLAPDAINSQISTLNSLLAEKPAVIEKSAFLPSVNAGALIKARPFYYDDDFLDIRGYSMITQFGQSFWPINNHDMFYTFQGMTTDGKYWVSMNFPITQQNLPSNGDYIQNQDFEEFANTFQDYVTQTRTMLDDADSITFNPSLEEFEMVVNFSFTNN